jgi:hypothetical protein
MLKRAGIASEPSRSLTDIPRGRLAQRCLACPIPDINLPDDWLLIEPAKRYVIYLQVDGLTDQLY